MCSSHCNPRENKPDGIYEEFELGFPNREDELLYMYAEDKEHLTGTVYPYVPHKLLTELLKKHNGIKK